MTNLCAHFGVCGGCALQDISDEACLTLKYRIVCDALAGHGLDAARVGHPHAVAPASRRRASLAVSLRDGVAETGFRARRSHAVVDLRECRVLTPALVALVQSFRGIVPSLLRNGEEADLRLTETENGADLALKLPRRCTPDVAQALSRWATREGVARVTVNGRTAVQLARPEATLAGVTVALPESAFLQPTREGEAILQAHVCEAVGRAKRIVDLFAGCGTFALALARRASVHAVDSDAGALGALADAVRRASGLKPVTTEVRDLVRLPLQTREFDDYNAAVLDPPRAGALAQAKMLAGSRIGRIAYVSCNPQSFARDARVLADGDFEVGWVRPIDQFLWSSHIELVALFERR
ncbi:MAG: class I SAM-dependent RNA methyltransferase [Rhizomicrobium sp.]